MAFFKLMRSHSFFFNIRSLIKKVVSSSLATIEKIEKSLFLELWDHNRYLLIKWTSLCGEAINIHPFSIQRTNKMGATHKRKERVGDKEVIEIQHLRIYNKGEI